MTYTTLSALSLTLPNSATPSTLLPNGDEVLRMLLEFLRWFVFDDDENDTTTTKVPQPQTVHPHIPYWHNYLPNINEWL
ncbi:hypothetical protein ACHAWU_002102 [Discostella pseudostelligera]|uniref:Uncharacterized protein n=1 Tax=Discostella pseudostelligera TaxID=259834 RepID=A0ABD3M5L9_9STRA